MCLTVTEAGLRRLRRVKKIKKAIVAYKKVEVVFHRRGIPATYETPFRSVPVFPGKVLAAKNPLNPRCNTWYGQSIEHGAIHCYTDRPRRARLFRSGMIWCRIRIPASKIIAFGAFGGEGSVVATEIKIPARSSKNWDIHTRNRKNVQ